MTKKRQKKILEVSFEELTPQLEYEESSSDESDVFKPYKDLKKTKQYAGKSRARQRRPKRESSRFTSQTSADAVGHVMGIKCCQKNCINQFQFDVIQKLREDFCAKTNKEQSKFIVQQLRLTLIYDEPDVDVGLAISGKSVCLNAWRSIYGIKDRREGLMELLRLPRGCVHLHQLIFRYKHLKKCVIKYDNVHIDDPRIGQRYSSKKYMKAVQFMADYSKLFGEDQPHSTDIYLPSCVTKASVYMEYKADCEIAGKAYFKLRRFYEIWSSDFHHVKIRKYQTFSKCLDCTNFKEALLKKPSKEEKKKILEMRSVHLNLQRLCREKYYKHNAKAEEEPDQYISLIIDGMDQSKTSLPRFFHQTKGDSSLSRIHHRVTGVLCQTGQLYSYAFTYTDEFSADSNITINCLMKVLSDISRKRNGNLPPVLYIQADNCAGDNKNNYILYFLAQLVKAKIFKKIKLNFMMVGHTHEDIDQMFSRFSDKLKRQNAETLIKLQDALRESFRPTPSVEHLTSFWNFKAQYVGQFKLVGLKAPHIFKFTSDEQSVSIHIKDWPLREESYRVQVMTDIPAIPTRMEAVIPKIEKVEPVIRTLTHDLKAYKKAGRLTDEEVQWWETYLENIAIRRRPQPSIPLLSSLPTFIDVQPVINRTTISSTLRDAINTSISRLQHVSEVRLSRTRITL